ncbi:isochorismatase family protein [Alkalicoccobacillus plakortidis]|uniref:isochorismatase n=1 Tax=Alkalicoccobacillus plakortidis TaxID=444060 RepID=A0ABT0XN84_9BACI|nr:isochorismatase family protein [Alkalicoccobacillus plakortidis]MCM2677364.1 isochorismatase family protein [Alkalicoccobacillus plakortidis]
MALPKIKDYSMPTKKDLPTNRVDYWEVDANRSALLIHDMQTYFINAFEKGPLIETLLSNIQKLKEVCRSLGIPVYYTGQPGEQSLENRALLQDFWGSGLPADPKQEAIVSALTPEEGDVQLTKWRYSAFQRSDFLERLQKQGRDQLIITGVYAHIGCQTTAVDAFMYDIQSFFVGDALADFSLEHHVHSLNYVATRCGHTLTTDDCMQQLQSDSGTKTKNAIKADIAAFLDEQPESILNDENLLDRGLDSIRLMALSEQWNREGYQLTFAELAESPSVDAWSELLQESQRDS